MKKFITNTEPDYPSSEDRKEPVVFLSVSNDEDRKLIRNFLSPDFTVKLDRGEIARQYFDLCILDQQAFYEKRKLLKRLKMEAEPLFLPFLLLSSNPQQTRKAPDVLEFADDVVYIPVSTKVLETRIELLLRQREYSLKLEQKNQQLAEQNEQLQIYEEAIHAMNAGVVITDPRQEDNPIVFCNHGFQEITGYKKDEIPGRNCRFLQADDRGQKAIEQVRSIIEERKKGQVRLRNYRKDGTMFWNDLSLAPIRDSEGKVHHFVGIQRDVTELVEMQKQLQEEKERYRLIAENSTDMISRHGPDGIYLYVSQASRELIGYEPEELLGRNAFENIHPDDAEELEEKINDFQKDEIQRWTFRKRTKKGNYKWVESVMRPIFDESTGDLIEVQASTRDISDRKQYERMLEEEKDFIDTALESLPGIFYMLDKDLNFVKWNENFRKLLGYTDEEIEKMKPKDFFDDETIPLIQAKIREVYDRRTASIEAKVRKKNEELVPHYLIAHRLTRDEKTFIIGTGVDISERVKATKKLAESEQRWESLVQNDPNLVQIFAPDGTISFINESGARLLGFEHSEKVVGRNYFELMNMDKQELDRTKSRISKVVEQGISVPPHIYRLQRKDGEEIYLESQKVPIELADGQIWVQQVAQDVTDQVKNEQNLKEAIKEKETLLQEIHHRVKNNLAVVSSMLQLQMFSSNNPEVCKSLGDSEKRIKTMGLIHEQLYQSHSLSKIDFGNYVRKLVENVKEVSHNEEKVQLELDYDYIDLNVNQAVPCALILNEVISNAYEHAFTQQEQGKIEIILKKRDHTVFVQVRDNGRGMEEDRLHSQTDSMGFTIIDTLIKQLDADLSIQSKKGLDFSFSFRKQEIRGSSSALI